MAGAHGFVIRRKGRRKRRGDKIAGVGGRRWIPVLRPAPSEPDDGRRTLHRPAATRQASCLGTGVKPVNAKIIRSAVVAEVVLPAGVPNAGPAPAAGGKARREAGGEE